jgi:hypothetical protein
MILTCMQLRSMPPSNADTIRRYYAAMAESNKDFPAFEAFLRSVLADDVQLEEFPLGNTAQVRSKAVARILGLPPCSFF